MTRRARALLALGLLAAAACTGGATLVVDLRTDLRPGYQFFSVELLVTRPDGSLARRVVVPVTRRDSYSDGQRVAEAVDLARGSYLVATRLLDLDGNPVALRQTSVEVRGDVAITVVISSDCAGVACPGSGAPDATECLGARCVTPACAAGDATMCPAPLCTSDATCPAPSVACAPTRCVLGVCLARPDDTLCTAGDWCDPTHGCTVSTPLDAGVDSGGVDGGSVDLGGTCVPGGACTAGLRACATGTFQCTGGVRSCVATGVRAAGTVCRAAADVCDAEETCDGSSPTCPANGFTTGGVCRPSAGPCDNAESCDGTGAACPTDRIRHGTVCRAAAGACDVAETCGSAGADCPPDDSAPNGTSCGATWSENGCSQPVSTCMGGTCVHDASFTGSSPSCGAIGAFCGFTAQCCGSGSYFCVSPGTIYGSSRDCAQCCAAGSCCWMGSPAGPCR